MERISGIKNKLKNLLTSKNYGVIIQHIKSKGALRKLKVPISFLDSYRELTDKRIVFL